jgi:multimeric flavodoxin WrbA
MQALAILGSPRPQSVSTDLVRAGLAVCAEAGWETDELDGTDERIEFCPACNRCQRTGRCAQDDWLAEQFPRLLRADLVLVGSPIYFFSLSGQLKRLVDRCQPFWVRRFRIKDPEFLARPARPSLLFAAAGGPASERLWTSSELIMTMWSNTMGWEFRPGHYEAATDTLTPERRAAACAAARAAVERLLAEGPGERPPRPGA